MRRWPLRKTLGVLEKKYGRPPPPPARTAFEHVLWENVAYLADDEKRARAFRELKARVGLSPDAIAAAPGAVLERIAGAGVMAAQSPLGAAGRARRARRRLRPADPRAPVAAAPRPGDL
jgi:hypothetical protein